MDHAARVWEAEKAELLKKEDKQTDILHLSANYSLLLTLHAEKL